MDHGVDAGGIIRIAAHQERMEGKYLPQEIVFDKLRDVSVNAFIRLQFDQIWGNLEHITHMQERLIRQFDKAFLEDRLGGLEKAQVTFPVSWIDLFDLPEGKIEVTVIIKAAPLRIENSIERRNGNKLDIVFTAATSCGENIVKHEGRGNHRRPPIKFKAILLINISAPTGLITPFKYFDDMASGSQSNSRTKATKATSDDRNPFVVHSNNLHFFAFAG